MNIPGLGEFKRSNHGAWMRIDELGELRPVPEAWLSILEKYDALRMQNQVKGAGVKLSPGLPHMWEMLAGDKDRSFCFSQVANVGETVFLAYQAEGYTLIRSGSIIVLTWLFNLNPDAAAGQFFRLRAYRNNILHEQLDAPVTWGYPLELFWILPPGEIEIRIQNTWTPLIMAALMTMWERIPAPIM